MDPTMKNPVLAELHNQIMDFARDWARCDDRYVKGMAAGAIHAWHVAVLALRRTGQISIEDARLNDILNEYFCLFYVEKN